MKQVAADDKRSVLSRVNRVGNTQLRVPRTVLS